MSPHHFARLNKSKFQEDSQRDLEDKVDDMVRGMVAIIAAPFHVITGKKDRIEPDNQ